MIQRRGLRYRGPLCFVMVCLAARILPAADLKRCGSVDVHSMAVTFQSNLAPSADSEPGIETSRTSDTGSEVLIALGPIFGSMDSTQTQSRLTCTAKGLALTVVVTRSDRFAGAALQNVTWRPVARLNFTLRESRAVIETTWKLRTQAGVFLKSAATPPYPPRQFPVSLSKTITDLY